MQLDMFGATDESATRESAPPIMTVDGAWVPAETVAFNSALHNGSLGEAIAILNRLKTDVLQRVLLASGFSIGASNKRASLIAGVQSDLLAAVKLRMTGAELWQARAVAYGASTDRPASNIRIGDTVRKNGETYTVTGSIDGGIAAERIVSSENGVTESKTIFLKGDDAVDAKIEYAKHNNAALLTTPGEGSITNGMENHDGRLSEPEEIRDGAGGENRDNGIVGGIDRQPLDAGVARQSQSDVDSGDISRIAGSASGERNGNPRERSGSASSDAQGNLADVRNPGIAAGTRRTDIDVISDAVEPPLTKQQLNAMFVTEMTDAQLLQAQALFTDGKRAIAIARQIAKRAANKKAAGKSPDDRLAHSDTAGVASMPNAQLGSDVKIPANQSQSLSINTVGKSPQTISLPTMVQDAIATELSLQKSRISGLQSKVKANGMSLDQKLILQTRSRAAEAVLQQMRRSVFEIEDDAAKAIEAGNTAIFEKHALMFPGTHAAVVAHLAGVKNSIQETKSNLSPEDASDPDTEVPRDMENVELPSASPADYILTDEDKIGMGGLAEKFRDNYLAIQVLRTLDVEKRHAVGDELRALARYVGWGGLKGVFDPDNKQWGRQHAALRALLSDAEWAAASRSQLDAHYTAPVVVKAMYSAVSRLGFEHGRVLEPSCGVGNFFGFMPDTMRQKSALHGVELDILTSRIVSALYPSANIAKATGFQAYHVPAGYFDMAIGNPPFGGQSVSDEKGSAFSGWSIHNYFFAKSIGMLRPGGMMSMVVSHNFLDKLDPHVRQWIARRAELISGVRLPNTAFKQNANTEVVTDILIFQRLDNENSLGKQNAPDWLDTTDVSIENSKTAAFETVSINNYFINRPQNVLGVNSTAGSMYRLNEYTVVPNGELDAQLAQWVETLPENIYVPLERSVQDLEMTAVAVPEFVKEGSFFNLGTNVFQRLPDLGGKQRAVKWEPLNQRALERMTGMIQIRDVLRSQMRLERSSNISADEIESGRRKLNQTYDAFQRKHGFVNDPSNRRIFLDDTESALVQALEFDYEKAVTPAKAEEYGIEPRPARAVKADIFSRRVLFPPGEIDVVENAKDALLHSLNYMGGVDMGYMERAYGKDEQTILAELGDLLYVDPVEGIVTADQYLSGDVKTKLAEAIKAAESDPELQRNVEALQKIIPVDKLPSEIHAAIGAAWLPSKIFSEFAKEISGANASFSYIASTGQWIGHGQSAVDFVKNNNDYGTENMGALEILTLAMNSRAPEIKKRITVDGTDRYVTDEAQTEMVRQRADKIKSHWESWLWADGNRADQLTSLYNARFNRTVERHFDGSHLTFPGMSPLITLLGHQKNGVWRGLQDRTLLMDQVVGAGKTYETVALVMEMRRLGIAKKPLIAVPNHLTLQWRADFYRLYPGANVLAATPQDFEKENRERFFSKIVTGNWDAVIIGHSSLKKISISLEAETAILEEQLTDISDAIEDLKRQRGDRNVIRDMEKIKSNLASKMTRLQEKSGQKDKVVDFGDLGVDAMCIDELHEFKNLFFTTQMNRVAGLGNPAGSGKAFDLFVKIRWLKDTFGEKAPLITATGTPVSNSLAEMFTMQRFMQYSRLKANGLHVFDAWAKQYGDVQNVYEVAPSGTGYRLSQRFAKFKNLNSLMSEYRSFADVITLDHLKAQEKALGKTFPVPKLEGGRPQNVIAQRSILQEKFFGIPEIARDDAGVIKFEINLDLPTVIAKTEDGKFEMQQQDGDIVRHSKRYDTQEEAAYLTALSAITPVMTIDPKSIVGQFENLRELTRKTKGKVNALSLTGLANKAGLDYRLIDPNAEDFPDSKVNQAVRNMLQIGDACKDVKGVQLVFCDLSVPLSAKARMASKEKRIYVRDEHGNLTHKKGTLHTLKDYEGLPYYLVAAGKGAAKTFSMYDPVTGQLMKEGLDSKSEAHAFVARVVAQENGQERWLETREKYRAIGAEEIDEYKNEHAIDSDGEAADLEISMQDVEGVTGVSGFSIYDDIKAKLIANGVPPAQIEFIHDHDTPQAKELLFKRVNLGDVRWLFGSTPKMGAGTNVQQRVVALHHIDAPWRPSDLEQREGRVIRRGNLLYQRDPDGFRVGVYRYATAQTYDTRRWQLLEHKASGLEQLRNYSGISEMDDVANEAANSADMKAAASGNPLILRETQLATEVKKLRLLERAHRDGDYMLRLRMNSNRKYATQFGPNVLEALETLKAQRDAAQVLGIYGGKPLKDKDQVMTAIDDVNAQIASIGASRSLVYRGLKFKFGRDGTTQRIKMKMPDDEVRIMETLSRSGAVTRMENWCGDIEAVIAKTEMWIAKSKIEADEVEELLGKPFDKLDDLMTAIAEHGKVQRALMKSNSIAAVKPQEAEEFAIAVAMQKQRLVEYGLGDAVKEIENEDGIEPVGADNLPDKDASQVVFSLNDLLCNEETPSVSVKTESLPRLKIVTPQDPNSDMEKYILVAADSIGQLRKSDVYRVLVESNRVEYRQAIAAYIKNTRPDLAEEVNDIMAEAKNGELAPSR